MAGADLTTLVTIDVSAEKIGIRDRRHSSSHGNDGNDGEKDKEEMKTELHGGGDKMICNVLEVRVA